LSAVRIIDVELSKSWTKVFPWQKGSSLMNDFPMKLKAIRTSTIIDEIVKLLSHRSKSQCIVVLANVPAKLF